MLSFVTEIQQVTQVTCSLGTSGSNNELHLRNWRAPFANGTIFLGQILL